MYGMHVACVHKDIGVSTRTVCMLPVCTHIHCIVVLYNYTIYVEIHTLCTHKYTNRIIYVFREQSGKRWQGRTHMVHHYSTMFIMLCQLATVTTHTQRRKVHKLLSVKSTMVFEF